jgi:hypothetical protein
MARPKCIAGEPDPGAEVEQPREQLRRYLAEQQLRKRRRRSEQSGRRQRHRDARPERGMISLHHADTRNVGPLPLQTAIIN